MSQDLFDDLFAEATRDWTTRQRDALSKVLAPKARKNPQLWVQPGAGQERREQMIRWLNEEASRLIEAAAKLQGVGTEPEEHSHQDEDDR